MTSNEYDVKFLQIFSQFIIDMEKLPPDVAHPGIGETMEDICSLLRIARVSIDITEVLFSVQSRIPQNHFHVFYSAGTFDEEHPFKFKKITGSKGTAIYSVYPFINSEPWTAQEMDKIKLFLTTLFTFNGRARLTDHVRRLTFNDRELEVYNLNYFMKTSSGLIATRSIYNYASCRFNMTKFSLVNKRLGRKNGTEVMRRYINGLNDIISPEGFICRLGGDNFTCLFLKNDFEKVKDYLMGRMIETGVMGLETINVSCRTAYFFINEDVHSADDIMEYISLSFAMLRRMGNKSCLIYDDEVRKKVENSRWVESLFNDALRNEEFVVYYQPKVELNKYTLIGAEALCRWKHDGQLISPARFIPVLEQSNNICVLDFYMLDHVCRDIRRWLDEGLPVVKVSVNMSRVHLGSEDLSTKIIEIIRRNNVPNEYIEIELTETTTDVDFTELKRVVSSLHRAGISTSIDDFGIGYSSLNLIRELPWNVLKIDKSFLPEDSDENSSQKKIMLKYVIAMAQSLGLEIIVEGVETIEQVALLKESNCFNAQGFYFDRPLPLEEFEKRIVTGQFSQCTDTVR